MTLRKITIDNSVKYRHSTNTPPIETSHHTKPTTRKKDVSIKKLAQNKKKFNKKITRERFGIHK